VKMVREQRLEHLLAFMSKGESPPPVVIAYGPDQYTRDQVISRACEICLPGERDRVFGLEEYEANEVDPPRFLGALRTIPFGLPRKVVILRRFELAAGSVKKADRAKGEAGKKVTPLEEALIKYFRHPSGRTILLISSSLELKKSHPLVRALPGNAVLVPCMGFRGHDAVAFVRERLREMGKKASVSWIEQFVEICGSDAQKLAGELEKIALFSGDRSDLKDEDMVIVSAGEFSRDVFALLDAIAQQRSDLAVEIMREIVKSGEPPLKVLSVLLWHYRLIAKAHRLERFGRAGDDIRIHSSRFVVRKVTQHARRISSASLRTIFSRLKETDKELKGSRLPPIHVMENLAYFLSCRDVHLETAPLG